MSYAPVVLTGGNHYNGLALARVFHRHGIDAYGIIIGQGAEKGFLRTSNCWKNTSFIKDESELIPILTEMSAAFRGNDYDSLPVLIAWSDGAAAEIDRHLDELKGSYIVPSIGGSQGALYGMMDKEKQLSFAEKCGLLSASSAVLSVDDPDAPAKSPYPSFCKPLISSEGDKKDMRRIPDPAQMKSYLKELSVKGYQKILSQEFLDIDTEFDILGCCDQKVSTYLVSQKVRIWPKVGGPTSYSFTVDIPEFNAVAERIISELRSIGYSGMYDVDLFKVGDKIYFNEINWRNSALCYIAVCNGVPYPVIWYMAVTGHEYDSFPVKPEQYGLFSMNEMVDIYHALGHELSLSEWRKQRNGCVGLAYADDEDPAPARHKITHAVLNRLTGKAQRHTED